MRFFLIASVLLLAACAYAPTVHKIDIQQGNVVTDAALAKLKPGMTRAQVRFVLGTPLVADMFHPDRWDYVYRFAKADKVLENRRVTVVFSGDALVRVEGDVPEAVQAVPNP